MAVGFVAEVAAAAGTAVARPAPPIEALPKIQGHCQPSMSERISMTVVPNRVKQNQK